MRITILNKIVGSFTLFVFLILAPTHADAASPTLQQAKKEAEAKGYIFFTTHDEIVAMAKKEGKLRVMTSLGNQNFKPLINGFKQKYPFITDIYIEDISGRDNYQRILHELQAGQAKGWDLVHIPPDLAKEYMAYLMKHDVLGMAERGVLKIHPKMIHPVERNAVAPTSDIRVVPYNRKLISDDKVPAKFEDLLKPEFKGKKFVADLRPLTLAGLVPAWGLERTLDFARKLAAQQPVWGRGANRVTLAIAVGEYSLGIDSTLGVVTRVKAKDRTGNFSYKVVDPVPTMAIDHVNGILNTADHPHAALLWLEFLTSTEGQEILDKYEPLTASVFTPGSAIAQAVRGKEVSAIDWDHHTKFEGYQAKIVEALGFPIVDEKLKAK
ncbi:MAG: extracellular solute-binding protein [Deltaproteobacteria bacterium]|nr:extracellular solute-binding protein [Deltaproteobacteria bacterium]